jgi:hypothetical protein
VAFVVAWEFQMTNVSAMEIVSTSVVCVMDQDFQSVIAIAMGIN